MDDNQIRITIVIAGRRFGINILRDDEEYIRKAAVRINELITKYQQRFSNDKTDDYISMAALQLATELVRIENSKDLSPIFDHLTDIEQELDKKID